MLFSITPIAYVEFHNSRRPRVPIDPLAHSLTRQFGTPAGEFHEHRHDDFGIAGDEERGSIARQLRRAHPPHEVILQITHHERGGDG